MRVHVYVRGGSGGTVRRKEPIYVRYHPERTEMTQTNFLRSVGAAESATERKKSIVTATVAETANPEKAQTAFLRPESGALPPLSPTLPAKCVLREVCNFTGIYPTTVRFHFTR